jgi:apolipoprotein N-acyltransferase
MQCAGWGAILTLPFLLLTQHQIDREPLMVSLLFALLSSALLILAFPLFSLDALAWVCLLPLFMGLRNKTCFHAFLLSMLCGTLFWAGLVYWLMNVPKYTVLHYIILMPLLGFFFGLFGLCFSLISSRWGLMAACASAPFVWVALEYARSHISWLSLPWGMLAHTQYEKLPLIQVSSFTGAYGVSFLIVAVNSTLALILLKVLRGRKNAGLESPRTPGSRSVVLCAAATALILAGSLIYGKAVLSTPIVGDKIKVALIQGNIAQDKKWDKSYAEFIMQTYEDLTFKAAHEGAQLIAWPETATPAAMNVDLAVADRVHQIVKKTQVPLLLGSAQRRKYEQEGLKQKIDYTNAAYLIIPQERMTRPQQYDKIHLLPFGEYLPGRGNFAWRLLKVEAVKGYTPGSQFTVLELGPHRFSAPICWESIFPYVTRNFVKNGAQFIVNIINAAYFGRTAAPYQVLSMNVFRAVENRRYTASAANTGISCIIDPCGRVVDRVRDKNGDDVFVRGFMIGTITPMKELTFYTKYGDAFAWFCGLVSLAFLGVVLVYKRRDPR